MVKMFYVKSTLYGAIEITTEIGPDNVYCRCPYCGKEVQVNLSLLMTDGERGLLDKSVLCEDCTTVAKGGTINGKSV